MRAPWRCAQTRIRRGELRVHCHCYFKKDHNPICATVHDIFRFRDSQPHLKADDSWGRHRGGMGGWGGAYYLQAPKIGSLFQAGSAKPFEDYPVAARWIFLLVQMQKITFSAARIELVKAGENLCRVLPDLDRQHAEATAARLHQRAAAAQDLLRAND